MQKSSILTIEWDKRFANILYIGTKSYSVKTYDIYQKRIIQDLAFNKMYPFVTSINTLDTLPPNGNKNFFFFKFYVYSREINVAILCHNFI